MNELTLPIKPMTDFQGRSFAVLTPVLNRADADWL